MYACMSACCFVYIVHGVWFSITTHRLKRQWHGAMEHWRLKKKLLVRIWWYLLVTWMPFFGISEIIKNWIIWNDAFCIIRIPSELCYGCNNNIVMTIAIKWPHSEPMFACGFLWNNTRDDDALSFSWSVSIFSFLLVLSLSFSPSFSLPFIFALDFGATVHCVYNIYRHHIEQREF